MPTGKEIGNVRILLETETGRLVAVVKIGIEVTLKKQRSGHNSDHCDGANIYVVERNETPKHDSIDYASAANEYGDPFCCWKLNKIK